jgi:hypothetical protein
MKEHKGKKEKTEGMKEHKGKKEQTEVSLFRFYAKLFRSTEPSFVILIKCFLFAIFDIAVIRRSDPLLKITNCSRKFCREVNHYRQQNDKLTLLNDLLTSSSDFFLNDI